MVLDAGAAGEEREGSHKMVISESSGDTVAAMNSLQFSIYVYISMATFWCYDYMCSLHEEWTYLLRSDWNKVKSLYIVTRYLPFSLLTIILWTSFNPNNTQDRCLVLITLNSGLCIVLIFLSECFFVLRTYVLWNNNKILLATMLSAFFAFLVASFGSLFGTYTGPTAYESNFLPGIAYCYQSKPDFAFLMIFILLTVFELGLMILTLICAIQSWRLNSNRLYVVLVRHNIFYYACGLLLSVANILTPLLLGFANSYYNLSYVLEAMILANLATRMHLHLWQTNRRAYDSGNPMCITMSDMSSMNFAA
ncbi:hypothetical protein BDR07DRAFT_1464868 [Suillus spraguei]|nr:hypothetical protein BDR07DRAFT_1464868 [Suillus spraguei]